MTRGVSFHRLAERELTEGALYYDSESPGLGAAFLSEVQRCIEMILDFPEAAAVLATPVRRQLISRFPYAVLYSIKPKEIRVLAVMNLKQRPMYWVGRE